MPARSAISPTGVSGADMFVVCIFAWALLGFGNVYYGVAQRARDVLIENLKDKRSIVLTRPMIYHAEVQHGVADMVLEVDIQDAGAAPAPASTA